MKPIQSLIAFVVLIAATGCETTGGARRQAGGVAREAVVAGIAAEPKGAYYVGRR